MLRLAIITLQTNGQSNSVVLFSWPYTLKIVLVIAPICTQLLVMSLIACHFSWFMCYAYGAEQGCFRFTPTAKFHFTVNQQKKLTVCCKNLFNTFLDPTTRLMRSASFFIKKLFPSGMNIWNLSKLFSIYKVSPFTFSWIW